MTDQPTHPEDSDDGIDLLDLLQTIVDNLRLLILGPLVAGFAALGVSYSIAPTFTAQTSFLPPQQQQGMAASMLASLGALEGLAGAASGIKKPNDQYVTFLKSNSVEDALIDRFDLMNRYKQEFRTNARKTLQANVKISTGKDGIITITVDDKDPKTAADIANAHVQELKGLMGRLAVTEAQQRRQFFEKQLQQTQEKLTHAEIAIKTTGISSNILKANPQSAVAAVASLQAQITSQEVRLGAMRGYLAETAPDFKQALNELVTLRAQLAKLSNNTVTIASPDRNAAQGDYISKYREFKYQETLFDLFAKQFEMAKVDESREGATIQVLDKAEPPELMTKPQKALIAMVTSLTSGFSLLLFVFIRQALRNSSKSAESADKLNKIKVSWHKALGW
jgi:uncharacterized protein involved in exopolysaccharide biosynthesis